MRRSNKNTRATETFSNEEELAEWARCRIDPRYFINKYCFIYGAADTGRIPFSTYLFQDYVIDNLVRRRMNIIKKPRQMGITWLAGAMALWLTTFYSYKNVVIISIKEASAIRFLARIKFIYRNLPSFLQQPISNGKAGDYGTKTEVEFSNNSRLWSIPSSEDAGRSEAVSWLIIDEAAFIQHMDSIWAGAYSTLSTGGSMLMLSTTNGVGNRYHKTYIEAIAGKNSFNPIDLRWSDHPDRDQKWYDAQRADLGPKICAQEVDCDFLSSGNNVFNLVTMRNMSDTIYEGNFPILDLQPFKEYVKRIEMLQKRRHEANPSAREPKVIHFDNYLSDEFVMFRKPEKGKSYVIGVDTALNKAKKDDNSAIVVIDYHTMEIVFEFCGKAGLETLPVIVERLGRYYNEAFLCIENTGVGITTVMSVFNLGYPVERIYATQDPTPRKDRKKSYDNKEVRLGFSTNTKSKPIMISDLNEAIEDGSYTLKTLRSVNEFTVFVTNTTGAMEAAQGYSDDLVMAHALALQGRKMYPKVTFNQPMVE